MKKILFLLGYLFLASASDRDKGLDEVLDFYNQNRKEIAVSQSMQLMDAVLDKVLEYGKKSVDLKDASQTWGAVATLKEPRMYFQLEGDWETYGMFAPKSFKRFYSSIRSHGAVRLKELEEYAFEKGFYSKSIWEEERMIVVGLDDNRGMCDGTE